MRTEKVRERGSAKALLLSGGQWEDVRRGSEQRAELKRTTDWSFEVRGC